MQTNILVIEDDEILNSGLCYNLQKRGITPFCAYSLSEAKALLSHEHFNLILLDVNLPDGNGFDFAQETISHRSVPFIFLTAHNLEEEIIQGLRSGADDYIVKPFSGSEVMARIRAILRRIDCFAQTAAPKYLVYDNLRVCLDNADVTIDDQKIILTKKELEILWTLLDNRGRIFSRDNLLSDLWGYDYFGDNRTVDSHIKRLRAKLDKVPHPNWQIKTIWGMGYKFEGGES